MWASRPQGCHRTRASELKDQITIESGRDPVSCAPCFIRPEHTPLFPATGGLVQRYQNVDGRGRLIADRAV